MKECVIVFVAIIAYKLVSNFVRYRKCKSFLDLYLNPDNKNWGLAMHQDEIVELFEKAGIEDAFVPYAEPVGLGRVDSGMASVFLNLSSRRKNIIEIVLVMFHRAMGVYWKRTREALELLFWVNFVLNIPASMLKYFGIPSEHIIVKVSQAIYWTLSVITSFFIIFFKDESSSFLKNLFQRLFG